MTNYADIVKAKLNRLRSVLQAQNQSLVEDIENDFDLISYLERNVIELKRVVYSMRKKRKDSISSSASHSYSRLQNPSSHNYQYITERKLSLSAVKSMVGQQAKDTSVNPGSLVNEIRSKFEKSRLRFNGRKESFINLEESILLRKPEDTKFYLNSSAMPKKLGLSSNSRIVEQRRNRSIGNIGVGRLKSRSTSKKRELLHHSISKRLARKINVDLCQLQQERIKDWEESIP